MIRLIITLLLLLPSLCYGLSPAFIEAITTHGNSCVTATAINGITAISENGTTDTVTCGYGVMSSGDIEVTASCDADVTHTTFIALVVDGIERDRLECYNYQNDSTTLTYTVAAGIHSIRVYGNTDGSPSSNHYSATFSVPVP